MKLTLEQIAKAVNGNLIGESITINDISIDSRAISKNGLFIAIEGEKFDGHNFCDEVAKNGAIALICHKKVNTKLPIIYVENTGKALMDLASYYRKSINDLKIIGLTGSVGKTTTKEMTYAVMSQKYNSIKTDGNLNNEIGMPKTLFRLKNETEVGVIEMGMDHFGEISRLSKCCLPNIGIITKIGVSHIEYLGSRDGILKAKLEILDGMEKGSTLIINGDDDKLVTVKNSDYNLMLFGINNKKCDVIAKNITENNLDTTFEVSFSGETQKIILPTIGIHNVYDALAAFCAGLLMKIEPKLIAKGLSEYVPSGMRQRIKEVNGITIIEDCYNASPDSDKAAISVLSSINGKRKIAVLGDMRELGAFSKEGHFDVGEFAGNNNIDILFTIGDEARQIAEGAKKKISIIKSFDDKNELFKEIKTTIKQGDAVLFKASRAVALEEVIEKLYKDTRSV
ncbi:MAG: UDP-N-acetylmuramoyl-tripeptide--D-alanyl-D-alanine ligase [Oscillospiraceae bacterium]